MEKMENLRLYFLQEINKEENKDKEKKKKTKTRKQHYKKGNMILKALALPKQYLRHGHNNVNT